MRTSISFVRHGQTVANLQHRYQSYSDSPLTDYGQRQVAAVARRLHRTPFTTALVSPVERTRALAQAISRDRAGVDVREDASWSEVSHGRWEGLTYREATTRFPQEVRERFAAGAHGKPSGGESLAEAAARVREAWDALLQQFPGGRVLVATHATPIQLILCQIFGVSPAEHWHWRIDLGSITSVDVYGGGTIVRMVNEVPRLRPNDD